VRFGRVALLGEVDAIWDDDGVDPERKGRAGELEIDVDAHPGLTIRGFAGEYELDLDAEEGAITQWGAGLDWTPLPGLQLRFFYKSGGGPVSVPASRDDRAIFEAHVYF